MPRVAAYRTGMEKQNGTEVEMESNAASDIAADRGDTKIYNTFV